MAQVVSPQRHIKLKDILGTLAGRPWDIRREKRGSTARCPRDFLSFAIDKLPETLFLQGAAGLAVQGVFGNFM